MREFLIRILQAAIQMLSPKKTPHVYYPPNYSPDDRLDVDLETMVCYPHIDPEKGLVSITVPGVTIEGTTGYRHDGDGMHTFTTHGHVTPTGKDRIEVFPGDRFYFTQDRKFRLLPRG